MATTSLSLGPYWEKFIKERIAEGRYGSASEVVREALRELEVRENNLSALRAHLAEGAAQADADEYVDFELSDFLKETDREEL